MRMILTAALTLACLIGCAGKAPRADQPAVVDGRQLLVLTGEDPSSLTRALRPRGYAVTRIETLKSLGETLVHLRIPEGVTIPEAIAEAEALAPGVTAGANHAYGLQSAPATAGYANTMIGWPDQGCPARRDIGLVDAGLPEDHPALISGQARQRAFHPASAPPRSDHGALMADLLIGPGRLTNARLFSANVIDPARGAGDVAGVDQILGAVDWMISKDVRLINISLAGPRNKLLNRALGHAAGQGVILVAAAGNAGPEAAPLYPAAFDFVLAVTAVDAAGEVYRDAVRGDHIDLAAPGVDVLAPSAGGPRILSGTSAATTYVTAAIAADPGLSGDADKVRAALGEAARDLGDPGRDATFGHGLIRTPDACGGPQKVSLN